MVSMAVLQAANAMVIPMPPSVIDFASTVSFIDMARTTMAQLEKIGSRAKPAYNFIKIVASRVDESKSMHREILSMMKSEEHTSELQSLMRISYAVFCLQKTHTIIITTILLTLHRHPHVY